MSEDSLVWKAERGHVGGGGIKTIKVGLGFLEHWPIKSFFYGNNRVFPKVACADSSGSFQWRITLENGRSGSPRDFSKNLNQTSYWLSIG